MQASPQAHGAAHGDVEVGVFAARELGCRVDRGARLVDDGVAELRRLLGDELRDDLLGLAARGAVSDDDGVDAVLAHQAGKLALGSHDVVAGLGGIDHAVVEELAVLIDDGDLAAGPVPRVEREDPRAPHGPRGKQALEVLRKDVDGVGLRACGEVGAGLALERGGHEAPVAVRDGGVEHRGKDALSARPTAPEPLHRRGAVDVHAHAELALALAAVDGEDAVVGDLAQGLREAVVRLVGGLLGGIGRLYDDVGGVSGKRAQLGDVLGVLGHGLGHDVRSAGEGLLGRVEAGLLVDVGGRRVERRALGGRLHDDHIRQRLEPGLARLLGAGEPLLSEGLVQVEHALQGRGLCDLGPELVGELALCVDEGDDVLLALLEVSQVGKALLEGAERHVVHAARRLLAVARDEGDGAPLVDELDRRLDVGLL